MLGLRTLLLSKWFYALILLLCFSYCFYKVKYYQLDEDPNIEKQGIITKLEQRNTCLRIHLKTNYNLIITYCNHREDQLNATLNSIRIGDTISFKGEVSIPSDNTNKNAFNYRQFLLSNNIKYTVFAEEINFVHDHFNLYQVRGKLTNYLEKLPNSEYLKTFVLADNRALDEEVLASYRYNGISHLLAISGMHLALISLVLDKFLKRLGEVKSFLIIGGILTIYGFITGFPASITRAILAYFLVKANKIWYFHISSIKLLLIALVTTLFINPYFIYSVGWRFSFIVTAAIILNRKTLSSNYFKSVIRISFVAFLASLPITINTFYQINALSVLYNIFFVPLVSLIIYPGILISIFIPWIGHILKPFISIMESASLGINQIDFGIIKSGIINIYLVIGYYLLLIFFSIKNKLRFMLLILPLMLIFNSYLLKPDAFEITAIDVGQADATFIRDTSGNHVLIDTGGRFTFGNMVNNYGSAKAIINYLMSIGVHHLDYLILTHGHADHMGDALYFLERFKVNNIILNQGEIAPIEQAVIDQYPHLITDDVSLDWLSIIEMPVFTNENDNSIVTEINYDGIKVLLMGDQEEPGERELVKVYQTPVDMIKISHHGSRSSTTYILLRTLQPRYSWISVGAYNRFNHPRPEVINRLEEYNVKTYRTDLNGMINIKIKDNRLLIRPYIS